MTRLSPKTEIINHFDELINRIDIDIEESIKKYKDDQLLGDLIFFPIENRNVRKHYDFDLEFFDSNKSSQDKNFDSVIGWSKSTKIIDYLNIIRQRTIEDLRRAQEDNLEYLKSKSISDLNQLRESKDAEEMKSRLFADKFYFQVLKKHQDLWVFSLFTIVVDFYLPPSYINLLE